MFWSHTFWHTPGGWDSNNNREFVLRADICHTLETCRLFFQLLTVNSHPPQELLTWLMAFILHVFIGAGHVFDHKKKNPASVFKSLLAWGQTDHLLYSRTSFLSICSGLDPDDTNPVFSPFSSHIRTHTLTPGCQWQRDEPLCLRKTGD